jgi:drug/metabolite transporter (DMT)-like permease
MYQIVALQILFACALPLNKLLLMHTSFLTLTTARLLSAGLILGFLALVRGGTKEIPFVRSHTLLFGNKIVFGSFLKYILKYWGLQYLSLTHMAFLLHTTPLWTAFLDFLVNNTRLKVHQCLGIAIGFCGSLPLLFQSTESFSNLSFGINIPAVAVIAAVACHSYGILCTKTLVVTHRYDALFVAAVGSLGAGIMSLCLCVVSEPFEISDAQTFFPLFVLLILISNVIGKSWHTKLLSRYSPTFLALADYLYPLIIAFGSYVYAGELFTSSQLFACATIGMGLALFQAQDPVNYWFKQRDVVYSLFLKIKT